MLLPDEQEFLQYVTDNDSERPAQKDWTFKEHFYFVPGRSGRHAHWSIYTIWYWARQLYLRQLYWTRDILVAVEAQAEMVQPWINAEAADTWYDYWVGESRALVVWLRAIAPLCLMPVQFFVHPTHLQSDISDTAILCDSFIAMFDGFHVFFVRIITWDDRWGSD